MEAAEHNNSWPLKYRPRKFSELVGQHEVGLLKHIVNDEFCPPVFMLCGAPGVGKTSAARVVAATLNCTHKHANEPCGDCDNCKAVADGSSYFVTEIDAASFGGAEDMRRVREQTFISMGSNKSVFIIDEAHSISWQGWNVLLKTFEEPVPDVYFILVTSEPNKVPLKIRTRSLRFDFAKVPPNPMREKLLSILDEEDVLSFPDEVLDRIIDSSEGSMREAIKLLQVASVNENEIFVKDYSLDLLEALAASDKVAAMSVGAKWWDSCGDLRAIVEMLGTSLEKIYFTSNNLPVYSSVSAKKRILALSSNFDESVWSVMMEVLAEWAYRDGSKAHFTFLLSSLFKAIYGSSVKRVEVEVEKSDDAPLSGAEVEAMLQGLES